MSLFDTIWNSVRSFLGPFGKLLEQLADLWTHIETIVSRAEHLRDSIVDEIDGWKNFKQDIRIKQRVIQVESAIEKTRQLIQGIPDSWRAIVDLFNEIKDSFKFGAGNPAAEAEALSSEIEAQGFVKSLLTKFPQLEKALGRLVGALAIIITSLEKISNGIDDVQTIVDEIRRLRLEIEKLDSIFLSQSNKRKTLRLADGRSVRIRVGKLHPV